jgi:hypothetical protein
VDMKSYDVKCFCKSVFRTDDGSIFSKHMKDFERMILEVMLWWSWW